LFGFLGENPVLVAKENLVTQLSNFLGAEGLESAMGFEVVTSREIDALTGTFEFEIGVCESYYY